MGSLAEDGGMVVEEEGGGAADGKRRAEDGGSGGDGDVRGGKRARDDGDAAAAAADAEDETDLGFFRRVLRQGGCAVPVGGDHGAGADVDGAQRPAAPDGCFFTSAATSAASVRRVRPRAVRALTLCRVRTARARCLCRSGWRRAD